MNPVVSSTPRGFLAGAYIKSLAVSGGDPVSAHAYAAGQGPQWAPVALALKASIAPMETAGDVLATPISTDFAELLRPLTLLGRMQGSMRRVPFNTRTLAMSAGASASWVGEGAPVPAGVSDFDTGVTLEFDKVVSLSVHTKELARLSHPSAELILAMDAARAAAFAMDTAFADPTNAGSAGIRPAAVTYGAPSFVSSGSTVEAIDDDLRQALAALADANFDLTTAYWLMRPRSAIYLSTVRGSGGAAAYPLVTAKGGVLLGLPVLTSNAISDLNSPSEAFIALVSADEVLLADDGMSEITFSEQAAIELNDAPAGGAQQLTSLWQRNLVALRALRTVNWQLRHAGAAAVIGQVQY